MTIQHRRVQIRTLITAPVVIIACGLPHEEVKAAELPSSPCVEALEQLTTLRTMAPVFKVSGAGEQQYLENADRHVEIARLEKAVESSCSKASQARDSEEADARRLHIARSPDCVIERDKLALMQKPTSRAAPDSVDSQRERILERCHSLTTPTNVWLVRMVWPRH